MKQKPSSRKRRSSTKSVLRLPDLEHAKAAVLNSLNSNYAKRGYRHAIDEFVDWYCSEPRLAFNRIVVLRYRSHLESRQLAPGTINLRLGAVRRLAYEAADCGLLSADLAAGIRRVKGVKKLGVRLGNWLTAEQGQRLWQAPDKLKLKGKRDRYPSPTRVPNASMDYLSDGITEGVIDRLSGIPNVKVISRTSAFRYKKRDIEPQKIAKELGVDALVTGRVLQRGDDLSVSAELVDAREDKQLWGEQYSRKLADIVAVQQEITTAISGNLRVRLTHEEKARLAKFPATNPEAYQLYLKG